MNPLGSAPRILSTNLLIALAITGGLLSTANPNAIQRTNRELIIGCNTTVTYNALTGKFGSPNYPGNYPNCFGGAMTYLITNGDVPTWITLEFLDTVSIAVHDTLSAYYVTDIATEPLFERLVGPLSNVTKGIYTINTKLVTVNLISITGGKKGFHLKYTKHTMSKASNISTEMTTTPVNTIANPTVSITNTTSVKQTITPNLTNTTQLTMTTTPQAMSTTPQTTSSTPQTTTSTPQTTTSTPQTTSKRPQTSPEQENTTTHKTITTQLTISSTTSKPLPGSITSPGPTQKQTDDPFPPWMYGLIATIIFLIFLLTVATICLIKFKREIHVASKEDQQSSNPIRASAPSNPYDSRGSHPTGASTDYDVVPLNVYDYVSPDDAPPEDDVPPDGDGPSSIYYEIPVVLPTIPLPKPPDTSEPISMNPIAGAPIKTHGIDLLESLYQEAKSNQLHELPSNNMHGRASAAASYTSYILQ